VAVSALASKLSIAREGIRQLGIEIHGCVTLPPARAAIRSAWTRVSAGKLARRAAPRAQCRGDRCPPRGMRGRPRGSSRHRGIDAGRLSGAGTMQRERLPRRQRLPPGGNYRPALGRSHLWKCGARPTEESHRHHDHHRSDPHLSLAHRQTLSAPRRRDRGNPAQRLHDKDEIYLLDQQVSLSFSLDPHARCVKPAWPPVRARTPPCRPAALQEAPHCCRVTARWSSGGQPRGRRAAEQEEERARGKPRARRRRDYPATNSVTACRC
jgi:hypothetical protein